MPACSICEHPQRQTIDALLAGGGASLRSIAEQFKIGSHVSVMRHKQAHILARVSRAVTKRTTQNDDAFLTGIERDIARAAKGAKHGLQAAEDGLIEPEVAFRMAPAFIQASLRGRELLGKATGRLAATDAARPVSVIVLQSGSGPAVSINAPQLELDDDNTLDIKAISS